MERPTADAVGVERNGKRGQEPFPEAVFWSEKTPDPFCKTPDGNVSGERAGNFFGSMSAMRLSPWQIAAVAGVLLPAASFLFVASAPAATIAVSLLGSGAALALLLIPEMSVLLWLGVSSVLAVALLLLHGIARSALPFLAHQPYLVCLGVFSGLLGALAAFILWRTRWPRILCGWTRGDVIFLLALFPVLGSTWAVATTNGFVRTPYGGEAFLARGFVNGDTMTLFTLVNASALRPGGALLRENPFAGNGPLEYPTLLHRALADILKATGGDITRVAWWLIVPVLFGTVAVSVLSVSAIFRGHRVPVWGVLLLLAAYGSTWESFTYPQSHTFLTGLFFLFLLLLVLRDQSGRVLERRTLRWAIGTLAVVLLFSNAVLGTAAVAVAVGSNVLQFFNRNWPWRDRVSGLIGSAILLVLFFLFPPGTGSLGTLNVAYTAVPQFLTAALPALVVLWALWDTAWLHRSPSLLAAAVLLPTLAVVTLGFSSRDIVAENSPRFLFLLVLVGWPAVIPVVQRLGDWWWRQVRHVEHTLQELTVLWGGGAFMLLVLLLPTAASVAGTLDVLVRKPPLTVSADELEAFAWVRNETAPDAVFLRAPEGLFESAVVAPLALPAFTGRAQLRSEYWLSPDDDVLAGVRALFRGEETTLLTRKNPGDLWYLFCGPEISSCPDAGSTVYAVGRVTIRSL